MGNDVFIGKVLDRASAAIDPAEAIAAVSDPGFGGIDVFIGKVRDLNQGRAVRGITYDLFEPLVLNEFQRLAAEVASLPLVFKPARAAFEGVDGQLEQAARTLGVSEPALFFRVTLPLAWRGILAGLLLAFARAMGEFGATIMVAGSIPGRTQTLSIAIYEAVQAGNDGRANLLVLVSSAVCIGVLLVAARLVGRPSGDARDVA